MVKKKKVHSHKKFSSSATMFFPFRDITLTIGFFLLGICSRFPLIERFQSHWDGPQYSLALVNYSFLQATPAPPGYPLYIGLGKMFYAFIQDPHLSMLMVSVFGSGLTAAFLFFFTKKLYGLFAGISAVSIFLSGSSYYYFGLTPYAYGLLPAFTIFVMYVCYQAFVKGKSYGVLFGLASGLLFAFRPQELLFMWPIVALGFLFLSWKQKFYATCLFIVLTLFWFWVVSSAVGGVSAFFSQSAAFSKTAVPFLFSRVDKYGELMLKGFLLSFGLSAVVLVYFLKKAKENWQDKKLVSREVIFFAVWMLPPIFFNLFVRTEHAGYQMAYLTGFLLLISLAFSRLFDKKPVLFSLALSIAVMFNLYWFFYDRDPDFVKPYRPTSFHYSDIRKNDRKVGEKVTYIKKTFSPKTTLILTTPVLWRPYMYHLKDYSLIDLALVTDEKNTIREARNWKMKESLVQKTVFPIPTGIKTIIFMDDDARIWVKNKEKKIIPLPGNSFLTQVTITSGVGILYGPRTIQIK